MAKVSRLSHQQIRQALKRDEVKDFVGRTADWMKAHVENVVIGGIAVVVLVFLAAYFVNGRSKSAWKASELLTQADMNFQQDSQSSAGQSRARAHYQEVIETYGGTASALEARLGLANCDLQEGKVDAALAGYSQFVSEHPRTFLAPLAVSGKGYCLEAKSQYKEAAAAFASVSQLYPEAANLGQSLLDAARNYGKAGDPASRSKVLEQALKTALPESVKAQVRAQLKTKG